MVYLYGMQAFALAMVGHCAASQSCTMAVSEADTVAECVRWHELYSQSFPNATLLPIRAGFWGVH